MFCPKCGKEVENSAKFCNWCGSPLSSNMSQEENNYSGNNETYQQDNNYNAAHGGQNTYQYGNGSEQNVYSASQAAAKPANKKGLLIGVCCAAAAVVIILIVVLGGAIGGKGGITGKWRLNYDSVIDVASEYLGGLENFIDTDYIKDMVDIEMTFEEDGTLIVELSMDLLAGYSGTYNGTYEITGPNTMVLIDDSYFMTGTVEYEVNGNTLTMTQDGDSIIFDRVG